jgi:DNA-binding NarL/FixJ family response regulator
MEPIRIAIFEDNAQFRESLEFVILSEPAFMLCGSFPDALRWDKKILQAKPDIILMDINMPGLNGIEAVKQIKAANPAIQICMQTVFEEDDKVFASLCAGASGYILKNTDPERLSHAITEVAAGGAFFTPSIAKKVLSNFQQHNRRAEYIQLSDREREILKHLVDGMSYKMIAAQCSISYDTVHSHIKNIYEKLHVNSKSEAVAKALQNRLV